jgi:hypothetical protein
VFVTWQATAIFIRYYATCCFCLLIFYSEKRPTANFIHPISTSDCIVFYYELYAQIWLQPHLVYHWEHSVCSTASSASTRTLHRRLVWLILLLTHGGYVSRVQKNSYCETNSNFHSILKIIYPNLKIPNFGQKHNKIFRRQDWWRFWSKRISKPTLNIWVKAVPLQAWSLPEGSRKLRFPDFMTMAQDGGKVVSLTHRPPLPPGNTPGTHFC